MWWNIFRKKPKEVIALYKDSYNDSWFLPADKSDIKKYRKVKGLKVIWKNPTDKNDFILFGDPYAIEWKRDKRVILVNRYNDKMRLATIECLSRGFPPIFDGNFHETLIEYDIAFIEI